MKWVEAATEGDHVPVQPRVIAAIAALASDASQVANLCRLARWDAGVPDSTGLAVELVWDAIGDAAAGVLVLDPGCDIAPQLMRAVRMRAKRLRRRVARAFVVPIADVQEELAADHPTADDTPGDPVDAAMLVRRTRELAAGDADVLQLLALYERDVVLRRAVLAHGMTAKSYRAARTRLKRVVVRTSHPGTAARWCWAQTVASPRCCDRHRCAGTVIAQRSGTSRGSLNSAPRAETRRDPPSPDRCRLAAGASE
jgi:hypothetical protein